MESIIAIVGHVRYHYSFKKTCATFQILVIPGMVFEIIQVKSIFFDFRAVLYRITTKEKQAIELSYDHKPIRPDEKARILRSGGKIERVVHDGV